MSKKAAEHHKKASIHSGEAAKHHDQAAKQHEAGQHEKAAHHAHTASGHEGQSRMHAEEAAKAHAEEHGKKFPGLPKPMLLARPRPRNRLHRLPVEVLATGRGRLQ
jgi:hypothetical protein